MGTIVWLLALLCMAGILLSLGSGLFHLSRGRGEEDSAKLARALRIRIGLSIALFLLLLFAWHQGWIAPHAFGDSGFAPHP
jgi:hypothetical protein